MRSNALKLGFVSAILPELSLAAPLEWHQPRIPGFGEMDWGRFISAVMETSYRGPICVEVEDGTFGKTLEGRQRALKVARNVLEPYLA